MIPEGWERVSLGDIAQVTGGKRLPKGRTLEVDPTPHPYIRVSDMRMGKLDNSSIQYLPVDLGPVLKRYRVNAGDLIISVAGTLGVICRVPDDLHGANLTENADRISGFKCDSNFLFHALMDEKLQQAIQSSKTTNAQPKLALDKIRSFTISLPPKEEQGRIAATLQTWDRAIETVEALIANARAQKQALMQQLLPQGTTPPKKRLPGFSGEWRETSLAELLSLKRAKGKIVPTNENGDGVPYIGSTSFLGEFSNYTSSKDALLCVETDILVLWDGEYAGKVATGLAGAVSSTVGRYRLTKAKADPVFVVSLMEKASERIRSIREGSGIPHMPGDFEHWFKFALPPLDEQQAIAELFRANRVMADKLQTQLTALRREKAALMQQLLTGKRRVKLPEDSADERETA